MADDTVRFASCRDEESLRELAGLIQKTALQATAENHRFLAYLLEMAHMEASMLLNEERFHRNEVP